MEYDSLNFDIAGAIQATHVADGIWQNFGEIWFFFFFLPTDPARIPLNATKEKLQIEKVPQSVNTLLLRALFPFAAEVNFPTGQGKAESGYRGWENSGK